MSEKKLYTREEFEELRRQSAKNMAADKALLRDALDVKVRAGHNYYWVHQTNWFGEPVLQLPQDLFALQEVFFKSRPKFVIELGVAWGGALLFYSTLMEALGGEAVIGVDIFIPDDLRQRLSSFGKLSERIVLINGSSVEDDTLNQIKGIVGDSRQVMIILDSFHTQDHVLKELRLYSPLIGKNYYLICADTVIEYQPVVDKRPRPWGPGNNPKTALDEFFKENDRFRIDEALENKLLISTNPGGYLVCVKD
jgi:cephalosporin hydroxylase